MKVIGGKILKWSSKILKDFPSALPEKQDWSTSLRQRLPSPLYVPALPPHWSYPVLNSCSSLSCNVHFTLRSLSVHGQTALLSHTLLINLWTTEIYVSTFWWIRRPRPRCQQVKHLAGSSLCCKWTFCCSILWRGEKLWPCKAEVQKRVSELTLTFLLGHSWG